MQSHDHEDFLQLYSASEPTIRAFVRSLVPNQRDASEIAQNTAVVLWRRFNVFVEKHPEYKAAELEVEDIHAHFKRWAMTVARYEVLSWRRDKARDRHVFSDTLHEILSNEAEEKEPHLEKLQYALETCLKKLPQDRRDLLLEAYTARNKPQELASRTGKTLNAFYQWMHRIRLSLVKCAKRTLATEAYQ